MPDRRPAWQASRAAFKRVSRARRRAAVVFASVVAVAAIVVPLAYVTSVAPSAAGATTPTVTRVFGTDRYATAAAIADAGWPAALPAGSTLLLGNGLAFPD